MAASSAPQAHTGKPHVLMTVDAVGGVWRYAIDLAAGMAANGYRFTFAGFGPQPSGAQRTEAEQIGELLWTDASLDWLVDDESQLAEVPNLIRQIIEERAIDLAHLNLPSQASGLEIDVPVLVVSHSCVVTWFAAVRGSAVPPDWQWQFRLNKQGLDAADAVVAPSRSHAKMLRQSYGAIERLDMVYNASSAEIPQTPKEKLVFAAGRWWDDGKNGALLDGAAAHTEWPVIMAGALRGPNGQQCVLHHAQTPGELAHADVAQWMARAAIVASPSRYEPFGLAPLEAARAGAALVLADIPTYRELWDGAALFAGADDPEAFAGAINQLAADEDLRADMAARAKERTGRYTLEAQVAAMQKIYDDLLRPAAVREA